jgi:hypothetical protein
VTVQVRPTDGGLVVSGELDMAAADDLRQFAASVVDPTKEAVLDIEELVSRRRSLRTVKPNSKRSGHGQESAD